MVATFVPGRSRLSPPRAAGAAEQSLCEGLQRGEGLCGDHTARRYSWTSWIAVAPSPTADATRLTERQRASPAANTPGMLVFKKYGSRSSLQRLGARPDRSTSRPVRMYPLES